MKRTIISYLSIILLGLVFCTPASADTLSTTEFQITNTTNVHEGRPTLAADIVVYTSVDLTAGAIGKIFGRWIAADGSPGAVVEVSDPNDPFMDNRLNDVSNGTVLYTAFDTLNIAATSLVVYDLAGDQRSTVLVPSALVYEARIHGNRVAFVRGDTISSQVQTFVVGDPTSLTTISGNMAAQVAIGSEFIVWSEGGSEIWAHRLSDGMTGLIATGGRNPATADDWVVYEGGTGVVAQQLDIVAGHDIAVLNTVDVTAAGTAGSARNPDVDGGLVAYEAIAAGGSTYDIYLYRLADGASFQVTNDNVNQELNSIYGQKVAYGDFRNGDLADIYLSALTFVAPAACAGPTTGLVGCYQFNGNASDGSGNGNHGAIFGGAGFTADAAGNPNGAINLDGVDDYVELPNESSFDLPELTIMATLRVPDYQRENWIINKGTYFGNYTLMINDDQGFWPGYAGYVHQVESGNWSAVLNLNNPVPVNEFFHLTVTLSGTEFRAYVNGNLQRSVANPALPVLNNDPVTIGVGGYYGLSDYFVGAIDELRIYNRALSGGETCDLYNSTFNTEPSANVGPDQTGDHAGSVVTLDGSGSSDPEGNYPLTYAWTIVSAPSGSGSTLDDPSAVNPSFTPDLTGDYTLGLRVTDSCGMQSVQDTVLISTTNTPPVADAGPPQTITNLGTVVQIDGSQSDDADGDAITYAWSIDQKPQGSSALLSDPSIVNPTFVADVQGTYLVSLVVTDTFGAASTPDSVTVSFSNVPPVADAGGDQAVIVGDEVFLDGSGTDANGDSLTYSWSLVSVPSGSSATIIDATTPLAHFTADQPGTYIVGLVVNDGFVDSAPDNVSIVATTLADTVVQLLQEAIYLINGFDPAVFKKKKDAKKLTKEINKALEELDEGEPDKALDKLAKKVLRRIDGCATSGEPDKDDRIIDCDAQSKVYDLIMQAIQLLGG